MTSVLLKKTRPIILRIWAAAPSIVYGVYAGAVLPRADEAKAGAPGGRREGVARPHDETLRDSHAQHYPRKFGVVLGLDSVAERGGRAYFLRGDGGRAPCEPRWRVQQKELFSISDDAELSLMQTMVRSSGTHAGGGIPRALWLHLLNMLPLTPLWRSPCPPTTAVPNSLPACAGVRLPSPTRARWWNTSSAASE